MTRIVEFPRPAKKPHRKHMGIIAEPVDLRGHTTNAQVNFTCVHCGNVHHMQFDNVIFRSVDLFCGKCGNGWRLSNPMFSAKKGQAGSSGT